MRMLGGGKAFTPCHSLQTNGKIGSSCWTTTFAIWWRGIAKIQNEVPSMLKESLFCKMHAACLLFRIVTHNIEHVSLFSWPKGLSDTWGISKASSLLRSNHHQCQQCIRCLQATNPRDGAGGQETRHKSRRQALEWAKHADSLVRCPPDIWRWRRLDAKWFQSSGSYHQDLDDWANSREAAKWGIKANSPIAGPLHLETKSVLWPQLVMHWWGFEGAECVWAIGEGAAPKSWCDRRLGC